MTAHLVDCRDVCHIPTSYLSVLLSCRVQLPTQIITPVLFGETTTELQDAAQDIC